MFVFMSYKHIRNVNRIINCVFRMLKWRLCGAVMLCSYITIKPITLNIMLHQSINSLSIRKNIFLPAIIQYDCLMMCDSKEGPACKSETCYLIKNWLTLCFEGSIIRCLWLNANWKFCNRRTTHKRKFSWIFG